MLTPDYTPWVRLVSIDIAKNLCYTFPQKGEDAYDTH